MECKYPKLMIGSAESLAELIDTLWNVNMTQQQWFVCLIGINRYIMECKYLPTANSSGALKRINRYIMECK